MNTMESIPFGDEYDDNEQLSTAQLTENQTDSTSTEEYKTEGDYDLSYEDLHPSDTGVYYPGDSQEDVSNKSVLDSFLKSHGVDPEGVIIGEERIPFNDLDHDNQLDIINQLNQVVQSDPEVDLNDEEINLINDIRLKSGSVQNYLDSLISESTQKYLEKMNEEEESIANFTDDELFLTDLFSDVGEISEEEALEQLRLAKSNPNVFSKKMDALRTKYIDKENKIKEQEEALKYEQEQKQAKEQEAIIVNALNNKRSLDLGSTILDLSAEDLDEVASFILDVDQNGVNHLEKVLSDPDSLVDMALFATKGKDIITNLDSYYKNQIKQVAKFNYEKGLAEAKNQLKGPRSVTKKTASKSVSQQNKGPISIHEVPL